MINNAQKHKLVGAISSALWGFPNDKDLEIQNSALWFVQDDFVVYFSKESAPFYVEALNIVLASALNELYSKKVLRSKFQSLIVDLTKTEKELSKKALTNHLDNWLKTLVEARETEFTYVIAVDNLEVTEPLGLGLVSFEPLTSENYQKIAEDLRKRIQASSRSDEEKENVTKRVMEDYLPDLAPRPGSCLAFFTIKTRDQDFGYQVALEAIKEAISIIHFLGQSNRIPKFLIGIRGDTGSGQVGTIVLNDKSFGYRFENRAFPLNLDKKGIIERGLVFYGAILEKSVGDRTEVEKRLLTSALWAGNSTMERSEKEQFLKTCIALEALLGSSGDIPYGSIIGERAAFLLGETLEQRRNIAGDIKRIYGVRSRIAHEGNPGKEDDIPNNLPIAVNITFGCIDKVRWLIEEHKWKKFKDLSEFVDNIKYTP